MKTVMITGCSSGFGVEIANFFLDRGWNVVATMRTPREDVLPSSERLRILPLDIKDADSIRQAVQAAGDIDVLVNNAGIGWMNAVEGTSMDVARDLFETNTIGTIAMTQAILPQFRERKSGTIINVTSSVTLKPLPLLSVYTASKAAVNAFTESLAIELQEFDIRVAIVIPGRAPDTSFSASARSRVMGEGGFPAAYAGIVAQVMSIRQDPNALVTRASDVAEAVWRAATDDTSPVRIPAGADAVALMA